MKEYKTGDVIVIKGERYQVTKVSPLSKRCTICQQHNTAMPCTFVYNYNEKLPLPWSYERCSQRIPSNCYPKKLKSD